VAPRAVANRAAVLSITTDNGCEFLAPDKIKPILALTPS